MWQCFHKSVVVVLAVALTAMSCVVSDEPTIQQYGVLDMGAISARVSTDEATRATATAPDDFLVTVIGFHGVAMEPTAISDLPATLTLPVGTYTIEVSSPVLRDAGWECPWYYGAGQVIVTEGVTTTPGPIECTLGNVKVTVRFSESIKPFLGSDVVVYAEIEGGGKWQFTPSDVDAAYIKVPTEGSTMTVRFTGTIDGTNSEEYTETIAVSAGEWERVRFSFEENEGARTFHIIIFDSEAGQISDGEDWF